MAAVAAIALTVAGVVASPTPSSASPEPGETTLQELEENSQTWAAHDIDTYQFTYQVLCFCLTIDPVTADVVDGEIVHLRSSDGQALNPAEVFTFTIEDLFDRVEGAFTQPADRLVVTYDATFGFPNAIDVDYDFRIADEELTINVLSFDPDFVAQQRTQHLEPGWNLTSWTGATAVADATATIAEAFDVLFTWDGNGFLSYVPTLPAALNSLEELSFGDGLWIRVSDPQGVDWIQPMLDAERMVTLSTGLNLVAWTGPSGISVGDAVLPLGAALNALYLWDASAQTFLSFAPDAPTFANTAQTLTHGDGVWLDMQSPATWAQPALSAGEVRQVGLGEEVTLSPGDAIDITDTILSLRFDSVSNDSRCPSDVQCVTAGEATIHLTTTLEAQSDPLSIVVAPNGPTTVTVDAFEITLLELSPQPISTSPIASDGYRIQILVDRDRLQSALVPAPIDSVQINVAESFPLQYFAQITSIRPDGCASFDHLTSTQDNGTITIRIWNRVPAPASGIACIQVVGFDEHNINLGSDFISGLSYTVIVNNLVETFLAQ